MSGNARDFDEPEVTAQDFQVLTSNLEGNTAAERLRAAVEHAGGTVAIAKKAGISLTTLHSYLNGSGMKLDTVIKISEACGVRPSWLAFGDDDLRPVPMSMTQSMNAGDYVPIRRLNVEASAGPGALIGSEQLVEHLAFKEDWLRRHIRRRPDQLVLIEARGDSMEPTIGDGDLLLVDTSAAEIATSALHVLDVEGELLVKRLERRLDGTVIVISDNPRYAEQIITKADRKSLRIIGQVLWRGAPVR